jgi:DNA-binding MarR family transcriptional regulator
VTTRANGGPRDSVDRIVAEWLAQRTDFDLSAMAVITRLFRIRARLDAELAAPFRSAGLSVNDFSVLAVLRRAPSPHRLTQSALMSELGLTSGTVSVRVDRLIRAGLVSRDSDPADGRGVLVTLTAKGRSTFEALAPAHLANEDRLLSALTAGDRGRLAQLLRRLLHGFEAAPGVAVPAVGITVLPAHEARAVRISAGLSDRPGLLVADVVPGGPASAARLCPGDLLRTLGGTALLVPADLAAAFGAAADRQSVLRFLRGEAERSVTVSTVRRSKRGAPAIG